MNNFSNKNVVIVTHKSIMPCIPGDDLRKFLLKNGCDRLLYITHPLLLLKESYQLSSQIESYEQSKLKYSAKAFHWALPEFALYIKDCIYTLYWALKTQNDYDLYIGINNLNALMGLFLKKLKKAKKVVYYTIDLYPERFENKFVNWLYHIFDKLCVKSCDETWNVSPFLINYREKNWGKDQAYNRQYTIPIGIWFDELKQIPNSKVDQKKIVYIGHLKAFYGVDLAIKALPLIIQKIPGAYLEIIGGGEQQDELVNLAKKLHISKYVKFYGWKEKKEATKLLADAAVGLAPFNTLIADEKVKNADPAKIKDYLSLGIPVVMTNASINSKAIDKAKCGIVINRYNPKALANAVIKLLANKKTREQYRKNALVYVSAFDWNTLFSTNLSRLI